MAVEQFSNAPQTTITEDLTDVETDVDVSSAAGFPVAAQYRILIESELMLVTAGAGTTTWTVTRGAEGTANVAHASGATVTHILTAGALAQLKTDVALVDTTYGLQFAAGTTEDGQDQDRSTGSSYTYQWANIVIKVPLIVDIVKWDLKGAATYTLYIDGVAQGAGHVVGGDTADETWNLATPIVMAQGPHRFEMRRSASGTWHDKNAAIYDGTFWYEDEIFYASTRFVAYTLPIKITAHSGTWEIVG